MSSRDNAPDSDSLPPAFSVWMRRLDPLLEGEDVNPVYEAFRRRRKLYGIKPMSWRRRLAFMGIIVGMVVGYIVMEIVDKRMSNSLTSLGYRGICWIGIIYLWTRIFSLQRGGRLFHSTEHSNLVLPMKVVSVFVGPNSSGMTAFDLWMTGCKGRVLMEAVYLESREYDQYLAGGITGALYVIFLVLNFIGLDLSIAGGICLAGSSLYLAFELFGLLLVTGSGLGAVLNVVRTLDFRIKSPGQRLERMGCFLGIGIIVFIVVVVLGMILVYRGWFLMEVYSAPEVVTPILLVVGGLVLRLIRSWTRRRRTRKFQGILERADGAFELYMRRCIIQDPDS